MAEAKDRRIHSRDLSAKANACIDLTVRRLVQFSLAGAFGGLLLFRSPTARWASVAFGAGIGFGSAYIESSYIFSEPQKSYSTDVSAISSPRCITTCGKTEKLIENSGFGEDPLPHDMI
ncbi:hypothetical protein KSP39_PZI003503 [Platanthera zijinensis]|uniref:MICOS complex subunit MIC10 n=1 Tax=Platanthera zijinensis TaxID=2320716 RepID=A0AAP0BW44_9ASPA